jgi:hypothetical protein
MIRTMRFAMSIFCAGMLPGAAFAQLSASVPRAVAPEIARSPGPVHFMGLGSFDTGVFAEPASIRRQADTVEAQVLTVQGKVWRVSEGAIRWTWETVQADCAGGALNRLTSDHYSEDGQWVGGFDTPARADAMPKVPVDEALFAYLCAGVQPAEFQIVPTTNMAVAGIINAFADR